jgi:hypothetical protein
MLAFVVWIVCEGIALGPIINRPDDGPRTEAAFNGLPNFCGDVQEVMAYPFSWVRPGSFLNGPQIFFIMALFWGIILYLCIRGVCRVARRIDWRIRMN